VICDFGLAAKSNEEYLYDRCGTMGYIAPEIMEIT
jgi:serine/threonine protein kinase